ncbi:MAG: hypothetical protein GEU79_02095 [Acidimicrobiia bacterium]|nr:hypothetical protein [Acidimicrobiia bacterium]
MADTVENELSLFRTMLQARIDLLEFEQRRRSGRESRTLMEALPELLSGQRSDHHMRYSDVLIDIEERSGRRPIDKVIDGDPLLVLDSIDDDQLADALAQLRHEEESLSATRQLVHDVIDKLNQALAENRRLVEG